MVGDAGSVYTIAKSNVTFYDSMFVNNSGSVGGVITVSDNSFVTFFNTSFLDNSAS